MSKTHSVALGFALGALLSGCMLRRQAHVTTTTTSTATRVTEAFTRLRATLNIRCAGCHTDYLDSRMTPEYLATKVVAGHPEQSPLVLSLRGAKDHFSGISTDGTMPPSGDALSAQAFQDLETFITDAGTSPTPTPGGSDPTPTPTPGGNPNPNCNHGYVLNLMISRCSTCHGDYFKSGVTAAQWVGYGIVDTSSPANYAKSSLYCRLQGADTACADGKGKDMPKTSALSAQQLSDVKCYVGTLAGYSQPGGSGAVDAAKRTADVVDLFSKNCASCHNVDVPVKTGPRAGNTVQAFSTCKTDSCFLSKNLLFKQQPSSSWVYQSLEGMGGVDRMPPPPSAAFSTGDKQKVYDWINKMP